MLGWILAFECICKVNNVPLLRSRAVPNIRFVFASVPNSDTNSLFIFEQIVHPKTNSMTLTRPRRDERTAVGSCNWYPTPRTTTVILLRRRIAI